MKLSEEKLKQIVRANTSPASDERVECLSAIDLRLAASGELPNEMRKRVAEHLASCSACVDEFHVLRSLREWAAEDGAADEKLVDPRQQKAWRGWLSFPRWATALGVFLVAAISISVWILQTLPPDESRYERGSGSLTVETDPKDGARLNAPPERLSWKSQTASAGYRVEIYDFESTLLWKSGFIKSNAVEIPPDVRQKLTPGQIYHWRVFFIDGHTLKSQLLSFRLTE